MAPTSPWCWTDAGDFLITMPGKREVAPRALDRALLLASDDASLTLRVIDFA